METAGEPEVIRDKAAMRAWSRRRRAEGRTVVLVPTMGFLHEGHLALVSASVAVVVSIHVNPSQFAPTEDLATYPSDLAGDLRKLASAGAVHAVFNPPASGGWARDVDSGGAAGEGAVREQPAGLLPRRGHHGQAVQRRRARRRRLREEGLSAVATYLPNEADGLAMSSRNVHLFPKQREKALCISRSLVNARTAALNNRNNASEPIKNQIVQTLKEAGDRVDYVEIVDQESLVPDETIDRPVVICMWHCLGMSG